MPDAFFHWLHLMAAILWVGGTLFGSAVLRPALREALEPSEALAVYQAVGRRLTLVQWATWGVLLFTGSGKLWSLRHSPEIFRGPFGLILAVKLALVGAMVVLSLLHSLSWGPALLDERLAPRERAALAARAALWGKVNAALMAAIVLSAVLLRYNPF